MFTRTRVKSKSRLGREKKYLIKVTAHNVDITGQCFQVVERFLRAQVSSAQNVLNLSRHQELLELVGQAVGPVWNVKITDDEHQLQ